MSFSFTALQMEKYSSIILFHEAGPKCEQTSHKQADRYSVIVYCCLCPTLVSDIIFSIHLSISTRQRMLRYSFLKWKYEFFLQYWRIGIHAHVLLTWNLWSQDSRKTRQQQRFQHQILPNFPEKKSQRELSICLCPTPEGSVLEGFPEGPSQSPAVFTSFACYLIPSLEQYDCIASAFMSRAVGRPAIERGGHAGGQAPGLGRWQHCSV